MTGISNPDAGKIAEDAMILSGKASASSKAFCERMNKIYGWPMYSYTTLADTNIKLKFGIGTVGMFMCILSTIILTFLSESSIAFCK